MSKKIIKAYNYFKKAEKAFRCPFCDTDMAFRNENSLACQKSHCFDLAKQGYINFAPNQNKMKYTRDLFESRRLIFKAGFYDPVKESIRGLIDKHYKPMSDISILDAGCGEGFYISNLMGDKSQPMDLFAMDLLKDAVVLAAKENSDVKWMVGSLSNIPLQSNFIDIVLNIFTPANYKEFSRVMKKGGLLIKVIPGRQYLQELRNCAKEQLVNKEYSNSQVLQNFNKNMATVETKHLFYQLPVAKHEAESFINMTPMMFNVDTSAIRTEDIKQITIDAEIIVGRK